MNTNDFARNRLSSFIRPLAPISVIAFLAACLLLLSDRRGGAQDGKSQTWNQEEAKCISLLERSAALEKEGKLEEAAATLSECTIGKIVDARLRLKSKRNANLVAEIRKLFEHDTGGDESVESIDREIAKIDRLLEEDLFLETRGMLTETRERLVKQRESGGIELVAKIRPGADAIDLAKDKILILPADSYGWSTLKLDERELSACLLANSVNSFGTGGVSLEPMKPLLEAAGLEGMSRRLCYGAFHSIDFHDSFDLGEDSCGEGIEEVPSALAKVAALAAEKMKFDARPRYIFAMYAWAYGAGKPGAAKCRLIATIYDVEQDVVHSIIFFKKNIHKDLALSEMAMAPGDVFSRFLKLGAIKGN